MNDEVISHTLKAPRNPVYLPTYDGCFVCGQSHPRGLRTRFFTDGQGAVFAWFEPDDLLTGYKKVVHGGVVSALLDELIGWTVSLKNDLMAFTAELTVRFSAPIAAGSRYLAAARLVGGRGRCWDAEGSIRDAEDRVCARGRGRYFLLPASQTAEVAASMRYQPGDAAAFRHSAQEPGAAKAARDVVV